MNPTTCLDAALDYESRGWSVLPLCPPDHVGCGKHHFRQCSSPGKVPHIPDTGSMQWAEFQDRRATPDELRRWWKHSPNINVGVALGRVSGLVAIDVDSDSGEVMLKAMAGGDLPPTLEYRTGRGRRLIYALPDGVEFRNRPMADAGGEALRFMGRGSQMVMPPSRHELGTVYAWVPGRGPGEVEPAPAPEWLLSAAAPDAKSAIPPPEEGEFVTEPGRNTYLTRLAGAMRRQGADYEAISAALVSFNERRCDPPLTEFEVLGVARSVCRYAPNADPVAVFTSTVGGGAVGDDREPEVPDGFWNPKGPEDVAGLSDLKKAGAHTEWVWKGWIQRGVVIAFAAEGGTGKTRATMDLVRRVSHGLPWPDNQPALKWDGRTVALWVVGDNHHNEMVTLGEAFGTTDRVKVNTHPSDPWGGVSLETVEDLTLLERRIAACKPLFVVIDTVGNTTDKNLSKQEDAKAYYAPLQVIARRHNVVMLCLTHLNGAGKLLGRRALEKVRVAWRMSAETINDHTCRRRLEVSKSNSQYPQALGVTMGDGGNEYDDDPPPPPEERENAPAGPSQAVQKCMEWLAGALKHGARKLVDLRKQWETDGYDAKPMYKAKDFLKVEESETKPKYWGLPGSQVPTPPVVVFGGVEC